MSDCCLQLSPLSITFNWFVDFHFAIASSVKCNPFFIQDFDRQQEERVFCSHRTAVLVQPGWRTKLGPRSLRMETLPQGNCRSGSNSSFFLFIFRGWGVIIPCLHHPSWSKVGDFTSLQENFPKRLEQRDAPICYWSTSYRIIYTTWWKFVRKTPVRTLLLQEPRQPTQTLFWANQRPGGGSQRQIHGGICWRPPCQKRRSLFTSSPPTL